MHYFTLSAVVLYLLVSVSAQLQAELPWAQPFIPVKPCAPSCSAIRTARATTEDVEAALRQNPDIQAKIAELDAENKADEKSSILPVSYKCPCSNCKAVKQQLYSCDNCRIIWPRGGVTNVACSRPNSYCRLGCGCPGRCNAYGRRSQIVVLYCPGLKPIPFVIKRITLCTNCCCQFNYWWKG
ncbi:uncharacterized protein LOC135465919 [Liolophura sinensis]|uniref:uncharacterized protein LOC135465919 n=1 Tax=Liolophura sinensis TaxID=3198878 RepID=UPI0031594D93